MPRFFSFILFFALACSLQFKPLWAIEAYHFKNVVDIDTGTAVSLEDFSGKILVLIHLPFLSSYYESGAKTIVTQLKKDFPTGVNAEGLPVEVVGYIMDYSITAKTETDAFKKATGITRLVRERNYDSYYYYYYSVGWSYDFFVINGLQDAAGYAQWDVVFLDYFTGNLASVKDSVDKIKSKGGAPPVLNTIFEGRSQVVSGQPSSVTVSGFTVPATQSNSSGGGCFLR